MAMTLRLSDAEAVALRLRAERESRSMQDVARQAVREYIENHSRAELLDRVLDEEGTVSGRALRRRLSVGTTGSAPPERADIWG
jgi:hypothetical protein